MGLIVAASVVVGLTGVVLLHQQHTRVPTPNIDIGAAPDGSSTGAVAATAGPPRSSRPPPAGKPAAASAIVPGEVNRTSIKLEATYDADVDLGFNDRSLVVDVKITVTNRSGSGIDRVELNTITGPLGNLRAEARPSGWRRGGRNRRRPDDQGPPRWRAARRRDRGHPRADPGVDPVDARRLEMDVHARRQHPPGEPLDARGSACTAPSTARTTATRSSRL